MNAGFSIYARKTKKGKIYYVRFKQKDGSYSTAKSTGCTTKKAANEWALNYLQKHGGIIPLDISFREYAQDFFNYNGPWSRNMRISGKRVTEKWCFQKQRLVKNHALEYLGDLKIASIDDFVLEKFRNYLFYEKGFAGATVNLVIYAVKQIFQQAKKDKIIGAMPEFSKVAGDAARPQKETGVLTVEEVKHLFSIDWKNPLAYVANLTAVITGARKGEILALQLKNIHPGYIEITKTWDTEFLQLTDRTKSGKPRNIAITNRLQRELEELIRINPYGTPDSFVFFSPTLSDRPIDQNAIVKPFYKALEQIGIDRKARRVVFHSHRHFANTLFVNAGIPLHKVQQITGHLDERMTAHYFHLNVNDMEDVKAIQSRLFEVS